MQGSQPVLYISAGTLPEAFTKTLTTKTLTTKTQRRKDTRMNYTESSGKEEGIGKTIFAATKTDIFLGAQASLPALSSDAIRMVALPKDGSNRLIL